MGSRRSGLGRGLDALIPPPPPAAPGDGGPLLVALERIFPNPFQPRASMDDGRLEELAASVREHGVLAPLLVRPRGGDFELVAGERRLLAASRAGLQEVPVVVRDVDDRGSLETALVENLQREDLNPMDEAAALHRLAHGFHLTHDDIARRVGRSRVSVTNALRLLGLPEPVQDRVRAGRISAGHARALLACEDAAFATRLADRVVSDGLSVRAVETAVRERRSAPAVRPARPPDPAATRAGHLEVQALLADHLETRVRVQPGRPGRVIIDFATDDDLSRIADRILRGP